MNDPLLVRRLQGGGELLRDRQRFVKRQRSARDPVCEILPFDQFENERRDAV